MCGTSRVEPILITGGAGQLAGTLARRAAGRGASVEVPTEEALDITCREAVFEAVRRVRPRTIVNCAALTDVDRCEMDPELAELVNGKSVGHLADAANEVGACLVHVSTDYVFSGDAERAYREDDETGPINVYGRSKLLGERMAAGADRNLIVRTAWSFGLGGRNFVETIRHRLHNDVPQLHVVDDQHGCPTYCDDLADSMVSLFEADARGTVHVTNSGHTSWYGLAREIVTIVGASTRVIPVPTSEFPRPAPRPRWSVLDISRLERLTGARPPRWENALRRHLQAL